MGDITPATISEIPHVAVGYFDQKRKFRCLNTTSNMYYYNFQNTKN